MRYKRFSDSLYKLSYFKFLAFTDELKLADVTSVQKKSDPDDKTNYREISALPSLSKVYEKILYKQLNLFFEAKPSPHLYEFCLRISQ